MRSPEGHDAGTADADTGASDAGDGDSTTAAVDTSAEADDTTLLGSATADDGAGDDKGEGDKTDDAVVAKPDDGGVPEAYELKLTTKGEDGEDTTVELDPSLVEVATPVFKDIGLTNEQANKLLHLVPQIQSKALDAMNTEFAATRADWAKQAKESPEIGGKNWADTQRLAGRALDHFTGPAVVKGEDGKETPNAFRKLLNDSGLGNHPVLVGAFRKIGEALSEDGTFVRNTTETKTQLTREQQNYPEDQPK